MPSLNLVPLAIASALTAVTSLPAAASGLYEDKVYEDTFGNLVVYSPAGYKQIVVGKGYLAADLRGDSDYPASPPQSLRVPETGALVQRVDCPRYGVLLKGRGYMYGLPDGIAPTLVGPCRD